jgi:ribosomal protein S18 acetylase RimI-like enzyme
MAFIRLANKKDLDALARLSHLLSLHENKIDPLVKIMPERTIKRNFTNKLTSRNTEFFVAEQDGEIIGFACGSILKAPPYLSDHKYIGHIDSGYVEEKYRGKGVGKELTQAITEWFYNKNVTYIELTVLAQNLNSIAVWRKLGFKDYAIKMRRITRL